MTAVIYKTDGTELARISDGDIDTTSTDLSLIGRLYRNYGELVNENFVKLIENFAKSSSPSHPIVGQLWYNTSTETLNLYRASGFIGLAVLTSSAAVPNLPKTGDLWYDTFNEQLKMYTGEIWLVVAPQYTTLQNKSGLFVETIQDTSNNNHICSVTYQSGAVISIHCRDVEWTPKNAISGFSTVKPGINLANVNSQQFIGTVSNAASLGGIVAASYLRNDLDGTIAGTLTLANDGLIIGSSNDFQLYVDTNKSYIGRADGSINLSVGGIDILSVSDSNQALFIGGAESAPTITFVGETDSGMYLVETNIIGVSIAGNNILEISEDGLYVNGTIQASSFAGTLTTDTLTANNIVTSNLSVTTSAVLSSLEVDGNTILGGTSANTLQITGTNIYIPNGIRFNAHDVAFEGQVKFGSTITTINGTSPVTVANDFQVNGDTTVNALVVNDTINVAGLLETDETGRLTLNSSVATGYSNIGDFTMGSLNGIRSYNSPKMWIAFNGTLAGLAVYDSFNIDYVTRTSSNHYSFTTNSPISSGAMAVVGTNGTQLVANPSVGAISFSITTTSENARMALVVLSQ